MFAPYNLCHCHQAVVGEIREKRYTDFKQISQVPRIRFEKFSSALALRWMLVDASQQQSKLSANMIPHSGRWFCAVAVSCTTVIGYLLAVVLTHILHTDQNTTWTKQMEPVSVAPCLSASRDNGNISPAEHLTQPGCRSSAACLTFLATEPLAVVLIFRI